MTSPTEFRELPDAELLARLDAFKEELFNLRFQLATGQLDNSARIRTVRHDIARILTILRERDIEREWEAYGAETGSVEELDAAEEAS